MKKPKRKKPSVRAITVPCPTCHGRGRVGKVITLPPISRPRQGRSTTGDRR